MYSHTLGETYFVDNNLCSHDEHELASLKILIQSNNQVWNTISIVSDHYFVILHLNQQVKYWIAKLRFRLGTESLCKVKQSMGDVWHSQSQSSKTVHTHSRSSIHQCPVRSSMHQWTIRSSMHQWTIRSSMHQWTIRSSMHQNYYIFKAHVNY